MQYGKRLYDAYARLAVAGRQTGLNNGRGAELVVAVDIEQPTYSPARHDGLVFIVLHLWASHFHCSSRCSISAFHWQVTPLVQPAFGLNDAN